ncbi:MAG: EamA family transporter [Nitriliruptorales bacterium]|nr:EamA family transporter [Nitriliruptorales bacterium]
MLAAVATMLVGGSVAAASLLGDYPILGGQGVRYAVAALLLAVILRLRHGRLPRPDLRDLARLTLLALTGLALFNVLLILATASTDPAAVGVVIGATPLVLAAAGPLLDGRRPTRRVIAAALVVVAGAAAAQGGPGTVTMTGLLLAVGALACESLFSLLAVPLLPRLGPVALSGYACSIAAVLLLATGVGTGGGDVFAVPTLAEAGALVYMAVATAVAFVCWYSSLQRLGVERAGLFAGLIPVSALVTTVAIGTGTAGPLRIAGTAVVASGLVFGLSPTRSAGRRHKREVAGRERVQAPGR